jgi:hypothetical protein
MAPPRGHPRWGGKKRGTPNRATVERARLFAEAISELGPAAERLRELSPLDAMLLVLRNRLERGDENGILAAAQAAAPYCHGRLSITDTTVRHVTDRSDTELAAEIEALRQRVERARQASTPPLLEHQAEGLDNGHADLCQATAEKPHRQELDIAEPAEGE